LESIERTKKIAKWYKIRKKCVHNRVNIFYINNEELEKLIQWDNDDVNEKKSKLVMINPFLAWLGSISNFSSLPFSI